MAKTIYRDLRQLGGKSELPASPEKAVLEKIENPHPGETYGWIDARGQFAGHPVHIYTPVKEQ